jgi:hypothetical protein
VTIMVAMVARRCFGETQMANGKVSGDGKTSNVLTSLSRARLCYRLNDLGLGASSSVMMAARRYSGMAEVVDRVAIGDGEVTSMLPTLTQTCLCDRLIRFGPLPSSTAAMASRRSRAHRCGIAPTITAW